MTAGAKPPAFLPGRGDHPFRGAAHRPKTPRLGGRFCRYGRALASRASRATKCRRASEASPKVEIVRLDSAQPRKLIKVMAPMGNFEIV
jgi:hypothetical protein